MAILSTQELQQLASGKTVTNATPDVPQPTAPYDPFASSNKSQQPAQKSPTPQTPAPTPTQPPTAQAPASAPTPGSQGGLDPLSFAVVQSQIQSSLKQNSQLVQVKNALIKHLYDTPLNQDEMNNLPPDMKNLLSTGDQKMIETQIRLINDTIQGRDQTFDKSLEYIMKGYEDTVSMANKKQESARTLITDVVKNNPQQLSKLTDEQLQHVSNVSGLDVPTLQSLGGFSGKPKVEKMNVYDEYGNVTGQYLTQVIGGVQQVIPGSFSDASGTPSVSPTGKTTSAANVKPNSKEYRVAQDLAYGTLGFDDFVSLYPRMGKNIAQKLAVYDKARELNPNFNPKQFELGFKFAADPAVRKQVAAADNALAMIPDIIKLSDQAGRAGTTALNKIEVPAGYLMGNQKFTDFTTAQLALADEISGALGFGTASDMKLKLGIDLVDPALSPANFSSALKNVVDKFLANKRQSLINQMGVYGKDISGFSGTTGGGSITLKSSTGEVRTFDNLSPEDLKSALSQGYTKVQ